jgi:hypothetical protein
MHPPVCSSNCFRTLIKVLSPSRSFLQEHLSFTNPAFKRKQGHLVSEGRIEWLKDIRYEFVRNLLYVPITSKIELINYVRGMPLAYQQPNPTINYRSSYEKQFASWLKVNNINFMHEPALFDNQYIPDFMLSQGTGIMFIEVKGLWEASAYAKVKRFQKFLSEYDVSFYVVSKEFLNLLRRDDNEAR